MFGFKVNELGRYIVVLVWMLINIILFVMTYIDYGSTKKFTYLRAVIKKGLPIARGAAMVLNFNCMLILLTMCRNIISLIRSHCNYAVMRPVIRVLDKCVTFHKYIAYTICLMTIVHVGAHCFNFENLANSWETEEKINHKLSQSNEMVNPIREKNADPVTELFKSIPGLTGAVITLCLIVMVSSSTELISRVLRFQTNVKEHDPEYCLDHLDYWGKKDTNCSELPTFDSYGASTWKFILVPLILYFLERCLRFYRSLQGVQVVKVIKHPSNVVEIHMKKSGFSCEAGQYICIQCSKISQLEWHPFTLTSAPEEDYFSVHVRVVGDWTSALSRELGADGDQLRNVSELPRMAVDGPYGTASTDVFKYNVVMCIGAGIGVTPFASILKSIWYRHQSSPDNLCVQKVYFYWICRESFAFEWFSDLLKLLEIQMAESNHSDFIQINIFLTKWDTKMAKRLVLEEPTAERDPITGLFSRTEYGRPGWKDIFKSVAVAHNNTNIGVFFCGPSGLSHDLHKMCNQSNDETKGVKFFYNKENF
ncbi:cytochrome b-245 heavy chain-like isoform X2 [Actinia tenebrosa]|uniref:Cytochrome b-245 heavy chain-like isoform X2 n=1 Tax=Actinia tenebrosa TaxID=6105 RepID=A0A6P8H9L0_ACTTE|nr:cytochrome b-245 heavy chain-like isoform X2 [Actinia tenebrosa]